MKRKLAASVIILTVAFGGLTACSNQAGTSPEASKPAASASKTPAGETKEQKEAVVAKTYKDFLDSLYKVQDADVQATISKYAPANAKLNDESKTTLLDGLRTEFPFLKKVDVEGYTLDQQGKAYGSLLTVGTKVSASKSEIVLRIPPTAVTLNGDDALIDLQKIDVLINGKVSDPAASQSVQLHKDKGEWLIDPQTITSPE